ncbi:hypothetical protein MAGR_45370 [Mycolicibacterium agri]|uniref:HTH arsR-type domain-containing protein n=1 Tax=Mycolicibacterium agri TaxID=36811 RepID=A0A7I9W7E8_MYCAG|nr:hypothetical protein MAGR_45370 [Mycolicibacterium agri]
MIFGAWVAQAIAAAAQLKIADALADGPLRIDALADRVGADPDALARLMRALISEGIFRQRRDGRYALNALAETLRSEHPNSIAGMAKFVGAPEHREHWTLLADAVRTGEAVPHRLRGMSGWDFLKQRPDFATIFNDAMTNMSEMAVDPIIAAYDFAPYPTIVDVGGGHGRLLAAIVKATPGASGLLYDLPEVVEGAQELLRRHGVADRVRTAGGSFLDAVPEGGDNIVVGGVCDSRTPPAIRRQVDRPGDAGAGRSPRADGRRIPKALRAGGLPADAGGADRVRAQPHRGQGGVSRRPVIERSAAGSASCRPSPSPTACPSGRARTG